MLEKLIKDIEDLQKYKLMYERQKIDKRTMSEELYKLMLEKYNTTPYEERASYFKKDMCHCCRYGNFARCEIELPEDIGMPVPSDRDWIPGKKGCAQFEWS